MVGFLYLRLEIELGGDDFVGNIGREMALSDEARALCGCGACHDHYGSQVGLGVGFKKEGNIDEKPTIGLGGVLRARGPLVANRRMEDMLKLKAFGRIGEDQLAQPGTVRTAFTVKGFRAKCPPHGFVNASVVGEQIARTLVGVKKLCREMASQDGGKC